MVASRTAARRRRAGARGYLMLVVVTLLAGTATTALAAELTQDEQQPPQEQQQQQDENLPPPMLADAAANAGADTAATSAANLPPPEQQQNDPEATRAAVLAAKREVEEALANVEAAFDAQLMSVFEGAGLQTTGGDLRAAASAARASSSSASSSNLPPNVAVLLDAAAGDSAARRARLRIFRDGLRAIRADNARSGDDLAFGITPFSHLTPDEFSAMYLTPDMAAMAGSGGEDGSSSSSFDDAPRGRRRHLLQNVDPNNNPLQCNARVAFPSFSKSSLPTWFDWRNVNGVNHVTRIKNQGTCGSCAAFAVNVALEAAVIRRYGGKGYNAEHTDLSEQRFLSCWRGDNCHGALPHWYLDMAVCKGVVLEEKWPYEGVDRDSCPDATSGGGGGGPARFASGATGWAWAPTTPEGYSSALLHSPIALGVAASGRSFMNYKAGVFACDDSSAARVDHAVALVGYDDRIRMSSGETWGVFVGKNSWGTSWGEGGFFRVRKDCSTGGGGGGKGPLAIFSPGYAVAVVP